MGNKVSWGETWPRRVVDTEAGLSPRIEKINWGDPPPGDCHQVETFLAVPGWPPEKPVHAWREAGHTTANYIQANVLVALPSRRLSILSCRFYISIVRHRGVSGMISSPRICRVDLPSDVQLSHA